MAIILNDSLSTGEQSSGESGNKVKGIRYSRDYNLIALNLLSSDFIPIELKPSMVEVSYFEDIFSDTVSGQIVVTDALGIIEKLGIHGNEYIRMVFGKDDNPDLVIDKLFRLYKISARQRMQGLDVEGYIMHFCSDELILSEQYKISKSYKGKKASEIINDILVTYIKAPKNKYNPNNIENTQGVYSFIVPNFKPFEAINWVSLFAQASDQKVIGSDMVFFENANGYNFASLQSLFKKDSYFNYQYRPKNLNTTQHNENSNKQIFNVLSYELIDSFNTIEGVSSGMFANRLLTIDPLLHRYKNVDFNYNEYQKKSISLNKNSIVNNLQNRFGHALYETPESCFKMVFTNSNQSTNSYIKSKPGSVAKDVFVETVFSQRKSQLALANYTRMKFYIAGDPNVTVGMTINYDMLSQDPASQKDQKELDKFYSGKYLITAVRHMVQMAGYTTVIEVVKDSVPNSYNVVDNSKPLWKNTVSGVTE